MKKQLLLISILALLFSCCTSDTNTIFEQTFHFTDNQWKKFDVKKTSLPITDNSCLYSIELTINFTKDYTAEEFPIYAMLHTPSDESRIREERLKLPKDIDADKNEIALEKSIQYTLWKDLTFDDCGELSLSIEQLTGKYATPNITAITIKVIKSKMGDPREKNDQ